MEGEDYKKAASYWEDKIIKNMPKQELKQKIIDYINKNTTCALATGYGDFVRCTPIEYSFIDGFFYFLTEGGKKFISLEKNKNISIAIFDKFSGFSNLNGLQITAEAEIVDIYSDEYLQIMKIKKINCENLKKAGKTLYMIRAKIKKAEFCSSDFQKDGYFMRQEMDF